MNNQLGVNNFLKRKAPSKVMTDVCEIHHDERKAPPQNKTKVTYAHKASTMFLIMRS